MDLLPSRYLKCKSAEACEYIIQQYPFFLHVHKFNCFLPLIQDSPPLCIILSPTQSLMFLLTLHIHVHSFSNPFPDSASHNLAVHIPFHLLTRFTPVPGLPLSFSRSLYRLLPLTHRWYNPCHIVTLLEFRC